MNNQNTIRDKYHSLLNDLIKLTKITRDKIREDSDDYFSDNANFFTKSFVVVTCIYLESYLQEISMLIIDEMKVRLQRNPLPHNLIKWSLLKKEFKDYKYENLTIDLRKEDLDEHISGNVWKTINLFKKLGIDLEENQYFSACKDKIGNIVDKRNQIVHHNDNASDISPDDIIENIDFIKKYIDILANEIKKLL